MFPHTERQGLTRRQKVVGWSMLAGWAVIRLLAIPQDPALTGEFSHDSGYIAIVARNLAAGRGYVNDAHWRLALNPPRLPMSYHNANPLYPTLAAIVSVIGKMETARAAALVSAGSSVLLAFSVFWLVRRFSADFRFSILAAAAAVFWPSNFRESFSILPDALCTSLAVSTLAAIAHARRWWMWVLAGVLFGLAWLTRSSATLLLPGVAVWIFFQDRKQWIHLGGALVAAALTVSPWLAYTAKTPGSSLSSDWLQEYHAHRMHRTVGQYWRSLDPPATFGHILRTEGLDLAAFLAKGIPRFFRRFVRILYDRNWVAGAVLTAAVVLGAALFPWRAAILSPAFLAAAFTIALSTASLVALANTVEIRYWSVANLLFLMGLLTPFAPAARSPSRPRALIALAVALVLFAGILDVKTLRFKLRLDPALAAYRQRALAVKSRLEVNEAVIAEAPYLFTYFTGKSAISPPYPSKVELFKVMERYGARFVLLPSNRLDEFYPGAPKSLAPELRVEAAFDGAVLFKAP